MAYCFSYMYVVGGGKGSCRFCGTTANTSLLAIGSVCTDPECLERSDVVCDTTLPCGHACCGVKGEEKCLPCLYGCAGDDSKLKQDAEDMCMMCYTEGLAYAACIQVSTVYITLYAKIIFDP
jgi:E3 ubiquitin-protein ligase MYCBP2